MVIQPTVVAERKAPSRIVLGIGSRHHNGYKVRVVSDVEITGFVPITSRWVPLLDHRLERLHHDAYLLCDFFSPNIYTPDRGVA